MKSYRQPVMGFVLFALLSTGARIVYGLKPPTKQAVIPGDGSPPTPLDGPALFRERGCAQCHTIRGVGGHKGPDLSGVGRRLKKDAIQKQIVLGGGAMPAFGEALPPEETMVLVRYLQHCRERTPAAPSRLP